MKFTKVDVITCREKRTDCIWVISRIAMRRYEKRKNTICNLMAATIAQEDVTQLSCAFKIIVAIQRKRFCPHRAFVSLDLSGMSGFIYFFDKCLPIFLPNGPNIVVAKQPV